MSIGTTRGVGTVIAISDSVSDVIRRTDMELAEKYILVLYLE